MARGDHFVSGQFRQFLVMFASVPFGARLVFLGATKRKTTYICVSMDYGYGSKNETYMVCFMMIQGLLSGVFYKQTVFLLKTVQWWAFPLVHV